MWLEANVFKIFHHFPSCCGRRLTSSHVAQERYFAVGLTRRISCAEVKMTKNIVSNSFNMPKVKNRKKLEIL